MWCLIRQQATRVHSGLEQLGGTVSQDVKRYFIKRLLVGLGLGLLGNYLVRASNRHTIHHKNVISNLK